MLDQIEHGYDRASNRRWRKVGRQLASPPAGADEWYGDHDGLDRLLLADRGTLTGTHPDYTGITNRTFKQEWTLESLGNWKAFQHDADGDGAYTGAGDLDQTRTHNPVNELTGIDQQADPQQAQWVNPTYDAAGNMTSGPKPGRLAAGETRLFFQWDAWNRLVQVRDDASNSPGSTIAEYRYDGRNYRIVKLLPRLRLTMTADPITAGFAVGDAVTDGSAGTGRIVSLTSGSCWVQVTGGTSWATSGTLTKDGATAGYSAKAATWTRTDYYYNESWQVLEERYAEDQADANKDDPATAVRVQWLWDLRYIDAPVCRFHDTNANGTLDETLYYCNDANMNVTALVDAASGNIVERYVYDAYGTATFLAPDWTPLDPNQSAYGNEILYCGYRFDPATSTYNVRRRILQTYVGWASREPMYVDSLNLREYCSSSPNNWVDWLGMQKEPANHTDVKEEDCTVEIYMMHLGQVFRPDFLAKQAGQVKNAKCNHWGYITCHADLVNRTKTIGSRPIRGDKDWVEWMDYVTREVYENNGRIRLFRGNPEAADERISMPADYLLDRVRVPLAPEDAHIRRAQHEAWASWWRQHGTATFGPRVGKDVQGIVRYERWVDRPGLIERFPHITGRIGPFPHLNDAAIRRGEHVFEALMGAAWDLALADAKKNVCGACCCTGNRVVVQFKCLDDDSNKWGKPFCNRKEIVQCEKPKAAENAD